MMGKLIIWRNFFARKFEARQQRVGLGLFSRHPVLFLGQTDTRKEKVRCIYEEGHRNVSDVSALSWKKWPLSHENNFAFIQIMTHRRIPLLGHIDLLRNLNIVHERMQQNLKNWRLFQHTYGLVDKTGSKNKSNTVLNRHRKMVKFLHKFERIFCFKRCHADWGKAIK